jgi:membrane fusion protein (multidrug efflux system)
MDPGAVATAGQQILLVQDLRKVWVSFPAPEEISRKIYKGQPAQISLDALPGQSFSGKVLQINPSADPSSRQFNVRIVVNNPKETIKPGMFARVRLTLDRTPGATVVPREAVEDSPDGSYVMVMNPNGTVGKRSVTVGTSDTNDIAILGGVKPGEEVVTMSSGNLKNGQKARVGGKGGNKTGGSRGAPGGGKPNGGES